jgi:MerC mercury resistance protein
LDCCLVGNGIISSSNQIHNGSYLPSKTVPTTAHLYSSTTIRVTKESGGDFASSSSSSSSNTTTTESAGVVSNQESARKVLLWKDKLLQFSNVASILCIMDCTILPFLTLVVPLLGVLSTTLPTAALPVHAATWIHTVSHQLTFYFVLPVGLLATTTNYIYSHRKKWITAIGWLGLCLILVANIGSTSATGCCGTIVHHHEPVLSSIVPSSQRATTFLLGRWFDLHAIQSVFEMVQHGIYHRITNLTGCSFLILSNYISYRNSKQSNHHHGHDCC